MLKGFEFSTFFDNPAPVLLKISRAIEEKEDFYRILIQSDGAILFLEKVKNMLISYLLSDETIPDDTKHSTSFSLRICYFAGGLVNMYQQWFSGSLDCSLNDISLEVSKIIQVGL